MSFINFLKENEELEINQELEQKKEAIRELFTSGEKVTNEMVGALAEGLGIEYDELESIIFDMLSEFFTDEENIEDIEIDGKGTDLDDNFIEI
ncbi:MAG: hypothetical protein ACOCZ5_00115 [bacterium]